MPFEEESKTQRDNRRLFSLLRRPSRNSCVAFGPHLPETGAEHLDPCMADHVLSNGYMYPKVNMRTASL